MSKQRITAVLGIAIFGSGIFAGWLGSKTSHAPIRTTAISSPAAPPKAPALTRRPGEPKSSRVSAQSTGEPKIVAPIPSPNVPLITIVDDLKRLADAGDRRAACRLGLELNRCRWYSGFAVSQKKQIEILSTIGKEDANYAREMRRMRHLDTLVKRDEEVCNGFPAEQTGDGWRYVLAAAMAGDNYSAIKFAEGISLLSPGEARPLENVDGWVAFRQNAFPLVDQAMEQGSPQAAWVLSLFYRAPQFGEQLVAKDPVKSIAYLIAVQSIASPDYRVHIAGEIDYFQQSRKLSDADKARAAEMASDIASKFRHVPINGVDFRNGTFERNDGSECK